LRGREEVHFEHGDGVRADGLVPECVDAEFGEFETDSRPEFFGELELLGVGLEVVDVYIKSSSSAIIEWFGEAFIALA